MPEQLVFVVGTRAQLIKVAPVIVACERRSLPAVLLMTGQHRETMQDLITEFGITSPQVDALPASEHATVGSLVRWLPAALRGVRARLREWPGPLTVLVHGDTLSTLVGAFAARRRKARVVHLESGLSSRHLLDPFPEELCRRLVFRLTDVAMCPNGAAAEYMHRHSRAQVIDTCGNTIIDAVALTGAAHAAPLDAKPYLVVSLHRFQNVYDKHRLTTLVRLIIALAGRFTVHFVLHPTTRGRLVKHGLLASLSSAPQVTLSPRMGYGDFLRLAAGARCVLTDGGSNQEELAALGVPTIVMRAHTERPDGLGANARIEADIPDGVEAFVLGDGVDALRGTAKLDFTDGPSARIARWLTDNPAEKKSPQRRS